MLYKTRNIIKNKEIVFKIGQFPHLSETFILAQIITAIKCGYDVRLLVEELMDFETSKQGDTIQKYEIDKKVIIEDYKVPKNKVLRLLKWLYLFLSNIAYFKHIINYYTTYSKFSLGYLFEWVFYKTFNTAAIFHIQYGNNKHPIDQLKKTGFFKPKVILTFHGHDAFFPMHGFIPNNGYYDTLFEHADLITANTPYLAEKVLGLGCPKSKLTVIPVGVDTEFFYKNKEKNEQEGTLKLITVGRLDKVKGHHYAIEVVRKLIQKGVDVSLSIIGNGEEYTNLLDLITKYGLEEKVFLKGKKSPLEVRQAFWKHDIYLLTGVALPDGRRESQGLATLEAQACGLPVVVFDSGGIKYTLADGISGFVCEEYDIDAIESKIMQFIKDSCLLARMSDQAVTFVNENYSQKMIDKKWEIIYSNLSNGK